MDDHEYESLPEHIHPTTHMLAGAAAGILEHTVMYPVDCVKTRMQALVPDPRADYRNVVEALYKIVTREGLRKTVRGIGAVVGGAGPAHAMYFGCYEQVKKRISSDHAGHGSVLTQGIAGGCATIFHDAIMNPADVIKQRMQVYNSPYKHCRECGRRVMFKEGVGAFYRSFTTQMAMNVPFHSLHFVTYEFMQDIFNPEHHYLPSSHIISGAAAGGIAAATTTPLDVCKTLLNTQERCAMEKNHPIRGLVHAAKTVYRFHGLGGFVRGISARVIYQMPGTAISWSVYEFFKFTISERRHAAESEGFVTPHKVVTVQASSGLDKVSDQDTISNDSTSDINSNSDFNNTSSVVVSR